MEGKITADLTNMSPLNLIIIFVGILILVVTIAFLIKKLNIQLGKGTIKVSDYQNDMECQTRIYRLGDVIENIDYETKNAIRRQTKASNYKIARIGTINEMCQTGRRSLFHAFKEPFFDYINANHFTRELRPDNYDSYRSNLLEIIHEQYQELMYEYQLDDCDRNEMDDWDIVSEQFEKLVDNWLLMVMVEVKKACAEKVKVYEAILPEIKESKHWSDIINGCINKNNEYIKNIKTLIEDITKKYKE